MTTYEIVALQGNTLTFGSEQADSPIQAARNFLAIAAAAGVDLRDFTQVTLFAEDGRSTVYKVWFINGRGPLLENLTPVAQEEPHQRAPELTCCANCTHWQDLTLDAGGEYVGGCYFDHAGGDPDRRRADDHCRHFESLALPTPDRETFSKNRDQMTLAQLIRFVNTLG